MLLFLLLVTMAQIWYARIPLAKCYIVIALTFYTVLNFANVDLLIIKNNEKLYQKNGTVDLAYLSKLSYDAMPELLNFIENTPEFAGVYNQQNEDHHYAQVSLDQYLAEKRITCQSTQPGNLIIVPKLGPEQPWKHLTRETDFRAGGNLHALKKPHSHLYPDRPGSIFILSPPEFSPNMVPYDIITNYINAYLMKNLIIVHSL